VAKIVIIGVGICFILITMIGYVFPIASEEGYSLPQVVSLCNSEMGQFGQGFSEQIVKECSEYNSFLMGIYGSGVVGLILIIVGAVIPSKSKERKE